MSRHLVTVWDETGVSYRLHVEAPNGILAGNDAWHWLNRKYGLQGNTAVEFKEPEGQARPGDLREGRLRRWLQPPVVEVGRLPRSEASRTDGAAAVAELEERLGVALPEDYASALVAGDAGVTVGDATVLEAEEVYWLDVDDADRYLVFGVTVGGDVLAFDTEADWAVVEATHDPCGLDVLASSFSEWRRLATSG